MKELYFLNTYGSESKENSIITDETWYRFQNQEKVAIMVKNAYKMVTFFEHIIFDRN